MCCVQQWDSIEIEEETDDNRIVKSNIRVPMQVSRDVSHRVPRCSVIVLRECYLHVF